MRPLPPLEIATLAAMSPAYMGVVQGMHYRTRINADTDAKRGSQRVNVDWSVRSGSSLKRVYKARRRPKLLPQAKTVSP